MSCLPGTPCFGHTQTTYPRGCGLDPCTTFKTSTDLVFYTGPNLPCIDVHTCDNMSLILQKIDDALCGTNLVQNIINTLINNTEIFNQFCSQIIQQCIDCDYIQDCVISTTSTSTTLHPICFGCGTYQLTNNSTYEEVVKFIDCSGITPCWTEITINAGQSLYVCACDASITSSCDVTISFISQGCSIPCVCKTYALINTQYDFDVTFGFDDCDRNPIIVVVPGVLAGSPAVKICACEDSLPDRPIVQVIEIGDGCIPATCDFDFTLEVSSTTTTTSTTTLYCKCYTVLGTTDSIDVEISWNDCSNVNQTVIFKDFIDGYYGSFCAKQGSVTVIAESGTQTIIESTTTCTVGGTECENSTPACMCYQVNDLLGCTLDYIACDGTVINEYALSDTIICAQVGSVVKGAAACIYEPGYNFFTPLGTSCITDAGCQCNCIEISSTEIANYEYRDCDNVVQIGSVTFGFPLKV